MSPCVNGKCNPQCLDKADYECICSPDFGGKNCTEVRCIGSISSKYSNKK